ncbi:MAG: hypothetical protein FWD49_02835 [Firmicutes bacterium]|nr:hypothetical protein [Bacillota bacterium]
MKRFISFVSLTLILALCFVAFVACGGTDGNNGNETDSTTQAEALALLTSALNSVITVDLITNAKITETHFEKDSNGTLLTDSYTNVMEIDGAKSHYYQLFDGKKEFQIYFEKIEGEAVFHYNYRLNANGEWRKGISNQEYYHKEDFIHDIWAVFESSVAEDFVFANGTYSLSQSATVAFNDRLNEVFGYIHGNDYKNISIKLSGGRISELKFERRGTFGETSTAYHTITISHHNTVTVVFPEEFIDSFPHFDNFKAFATAFSKIRTRETKNFSIEMEYEFVGMLSQKGILWGYSDSNYGYFDLSDEGEITAGQLFSYGKEFEFCATADSWIEGTPTISTQDLFSVYLTQLHSPEDILGLYISQGGTVEISEDAITYAFSGYIGGVVGGISANQLIKIHKIGTTEPFNPLGA